jgi:hypothetical protein
VFRAIGQRPVIDACDHEQNLAHRSSSRRNLRTKKA